MSLPQPERRYSWAEVLDRWAILTVKRARVEESRAETFAELSELEDEMDRLMTAVLEQPNGMVDVLKDIRQELSLTNLHLWDLINTVTDPKEQAETVAVCARELQRQNARRTRLKNEISALLGNGVPEYKTYAEV